jgi:hypothetical protein
MERRIYFRRNVFGGERAGAFVNLFGPGNVTFEADDRELGFSQAGINGGDADAGAIELEAPGIEQYSLGPSAPQAGAATAASLNRQLFGRQTSLPVRNIPEQVHHETCFKHA